jgi:hypothetical protein
MNTGPAVKPNVVSLVPPDVIVGPTRVSSMGPTPATTKALQKVHRSTEINCIAFLGPPPTLGPS